MDLFCWLGSGRDISMVFGIAHSCAFVDADKCMGLWQSSHLADSFVQRTAYVTELDYKRGGSSHYSHRSGK
eukprot:scaffold7745_cov103-Cylindrotheca_fusiformis.AAC.10